MCGTESDRESDSVAYGVTDRVGRVPDRVTERLRQIESERVRVCDSDKESEAESDRQRMTKRVIA